MERIMPFIIEPSLVSILPADNRLADTTPKRLTRSHECTNVVENILFFIMIGFLILRKRIAGKARE